MVDFNCQTGRSIPISNNREMRPHHNGSIEKPRGSIVLSLTMDEVTCWGIAILNEEVDEDGEERLDDACWDEDDISWSESIAME